MRKSVIPGFSGLPCCALFVATLSSTLLLPAQEVPEATEAAEESVEVEESEETTIPADAEEALRQAMASGDIPAEVAAQLLPQLAGGAGHETTSKGKDDYAAAFQQLIDLGLPDTKGARYVKLTFAQDDSDERNDYQRFTVNRKGNAWVFPPEDPDTPVHTVIQRGIFTTKVTQKEKRSLIVRLFAGEDDKDRGGPRKAEWKEVDPDQETDQLIAQFRDDPNLSSLFDRDRWGYDLESMTILGDYLILACHFHRAGHHEAGNKLARDLLTRAPYPFKVIDFAVTRLASQEYQTLLGNLYQDQDWQAFLTGIRALQVKYPRGWENQKGLKILIPRLARFVSKGPTEITPYQDTPLDPEIVASLTTLLSQGKPGEPIDPYAPACWLINPEGALTYDYGRSGPGEDWVNTITAKGMAALPTLIAAVTDPTFLATPVLDVASGGSPSWSSSSYGSQETDETIFESMPRPSYRGEIARSLVLSTLPSGSTPWASLPDEDFQLAAYGWWSAHKDHSAVDLAMIFLNEGSDEQQAIALKVLLKSGNPKAFELIEAHILNSDGQALNKVDLAEQYLRIRRGKGREFHEKFMAMVEAEIAEYYDESSPDQYQSYLNQIRQSLSVLVDEVSPEKVMAQISSGELSVEDGFPRLKAALGVEDIFTKLDLLLIFINSLDNEEKRLEALQILSNWTTNDIAQKTYAAIESETLDEFQAEALEGARKNKEHWAPLLKRRDPPGVSGDLLAELGNPPSEAAYAAALMNSLHFPVPFEQTGALSQVAGFDELWPVYLDRVDAFLESDQVPPYPAADQVPEDRLETLLAEVKKRSAREIIPWRKTLTLPERLALMKAISEMEPLPENLREISNICQKVDWSYGPDIPAPKREKIESLVLEKEVSPELIQSLASFFASGEDELAIYFIRTGKLMGPQIIVGSRRIVQSWATNFFTEEIAKLDPEKLPRLTGLLVFGLDEENPGQPRTASFFKDSPDSTQEKTAFEGLIKEGMTLFEPSDTQDGPGSQTGIAVVSISAPDEPDSEDE